MGADTGGRYDATSIPEQDRPPSLPMPGWLSAFKKIWNKNKNLGFSNFIKGWVSQEN